MTRIIHFSNGEIEKIFITQDDKLFPGDVLPPEFKLENIVDLISDKAFPSSFPMESMFTKED